jgi:hypothetical protein
VVLMGTSSLGCVELKYEDRRIRVTRVTPATINAPYFDKGRTKLGVSPSPAAHLQAWHHGGRDPACGREPGARPRRRSGGQGGDLEPNRLPRPLEPVLERVDFEVHYTDESNPRTPRTTSSNRLKATTRASDPSATGRTRKASTTGWSCDPRSNGPPSLAPSWGRSPSCARGKQGSSAFASP